MLLLAAVKYKKKSNLTSLAFWDIEFNMRSCKLPLYIASLGQHVVVTRAMWCGTEHFPP